MRGFLDFSFLSRATGSGPASPRAFGQNYSTKIGAAQVFVAVTGAPPHFGGIKTAKALAKDV